MSSHSNLKNMIKSFSKVDLEASFARVHQHTRNRNVGMILASRDTSEENRQRHTALKREVRLGRLRKIRVNKALEDFDENLRSRVISVLEQLHAIGV